MSPRVRAIAVLLCVAVAVASAGAVSSSLDDFMNRVLDDTHDPLRRFHLDPALLEPFEVQVPSASGRMPILKVNFTQGLLSGLTLLRVVGQCTYGAVVGRQVRLGCYIDLNPLAIVMNAEVRGDVTSRYGGNNRRHAISTLTRLASNAAMLVEIQGNACGVPSLHRIQTQPIFWTTIVTRGEFRPTERRLGRLLDATGRHLYRQLMDTLLQPYASILNEVLSFYRLPC